MQMLTQDVTVIEENRKLSFVGGLASLGEFIDKHNKTGAILKRQNLKRKKKLSAHANGTKLATKKCMNWRQKWYKSATNSV